MSRPGTPPTHPGPASALSLISTLSDENPSSGASPQLTPASEIDEQGFTSLFNHLPVDSQQEFFELLKDRVPTCEKSINCDDEQHDEEQATAQVNAFNKIERDLQEYVFHILGNIPNVSLRVLLDNNNQRSDNGTPPPRKKKKKEKALRSIFVKYAEEMAKNNVLPPTKDQWKDYPDDPRGCLVTVASREDITCLNTESWRVFQGEFKNNASYSLEDGIRQCAGYLWHQLWWFRIVQGLGVEQVYGFVICGPKCKGVDPNNLVVSLLVLSQCAKVGGKFGLHEYRETYDVGNTAAFDSLKSFLQKAPNSERLTPPQDICPGMMMIPQSLVENTNQPWEIVKSGTAALIFRFDVNEQNKADVDSFLKQDVAFEKEEDQQDVLGFIGEELASKNNNATFYLKIKTLATGMNWETSLLFHALVRAKKSKNSYLKEWGQTYFHEYPIHSSGGMFILMRDAGTRLRQLDKYKMPSFKSFCCEFLLLMRGTLMIQQRFDLVHGDIHEGNLLYNAEEKDLPKLLLIDWDEAERKPMKRIVKNDTQKERYSDKLLKHAEAYTKAQLILLFRDVSTKLYSKLVIEHDGEIVEICDKPHLFRDVSTKEYSKVVIEHDGEIVEICGEPRSGETLSLLEKDEDYVNTIYKSLEEWILRDNEDNDGLQSRINSLTAVSTAVESTT